jgi:hypothetical protein
MFEAVQKCNGCGAGLTLDDLRSPNCRYCGTVLPHRAQAEQQMQANAQIMSQMMAQQAQVQNQWRAAYGAGPVMPPPPGAGAPGSPYADPMRIAAAHAMQVGEVSRNISRMITMIVVGVVVATFLLVGGIVAFMMFRG